jgi:pimeloyl-ACP methyl ester carboxylesterase
MANVVTEHSNQEAATMIRTHETAPIQFVEGDGVRFAYRRFGKPGTIPLLFLAYFNSNMDGWDPDVTNSLAADHEVILFDNAGVGASGGQTPYIVAEMTKHCVAFCRALGLKQIHVVGFSLGGMIGQQLALEHRQLVGRLILLGTGPRGGEDLTFTELSPEEQADPVAFLLAAFFSPSEASQAAGREYMKRLESRKSDRDLPVSRDSAVGQLAAIREWGNDTSDRTLRQLEEHHTSDAHCSRQQGRSSDADQRFHSGGASAKRSAHHVPGFKSWSIFAVCRELPGKCEAVSRWVGRAAAWIAVQATRVTSSSPLMSRKSVVRMAALMSSASATHSTPRCCRSRRVADPRADLR